MTDAARVELAKIRAALAFPPAEARLISGYWRQQLLDVCDEAETLAAEVATLRGQNGALRQWVERHAHDQLSCIYGSCICGRDAALAADPREAPHAD